MDIKLGVPASENGAYIKPPAGRLPYGTYRVITPFDTFRFLRRESGDDSLSRETKDSGVSQEVFERTISYVLDGLGMRSITPDGITPEGARALGQHYALTYQLLNQFADSLRRRWPADQSIAPILRDLARRQPQTFLGLTQASEAWASGAQQQVAQGMTLADYNTAVQAASILQAAQRAESIDRAIVAGETRAAQTARVESLATASMTTGQKVAIALIVAGALGLLIWLARRR